MTSIKRDLINEIHAPVRRNFPRRKVIIKGLQDLFQADLVEMIPYSTENKGYKYILVVINTFSKFAWTKPLKTKTGSEVSEQMNKIFLEKKQNIPKNLQTDMGKEFYSAPFQSLMKRYGINHYSTYSNLKSSIVERLNRTLKERIWKEFSMHGNYRWLDLLSEVVKTYNNTVHTTTGFKPVKVNQKNAKTILNTAYNYFKVMDPKPVKFKVGDKVRISKYRQAFAKNYTPNWSNEIFTISTIQNTFPRTYQLQDSLGENILGGFYENELHMVKHPDVFLVEKVIKRKGNKVFVKWLGLSDVHNSWINKNNVL